MEWEEASVADCVGKGEKLGRWNKSANCGRCGMEKNVEEDRRSGANGLSM